MALNEAQQARLAELCDQDDLVPLPSPDVCRQVQALLLPRVPRPGKGTGPQATAQGPVSATR